MSTSTKVHALPLLHRLPLCISERSSGDAQADLPPPPSSSPPPTPLSTPPAADLQGAASRAGAASFPSPPRPPRPNALATVAGHGDYVKCLTYAEQGGILVSGGLDKRILLWDLQRMSAPLMVLRAGGADGGSDTGWGRGVSNNALMMTDGYSPAARAKQHKHDQADGGADAGAPWWSVDDSGGGAWPLLRDLSRVVLRPGQAATGPNEVLELCRQNKGSVHCVAAAADASLVASGGTDRMIRLLDPRAGGGQKAKICKLDGHRDNVRCVKIDEGGTRVVSDFSSVLTLMLFLLTRDKTSDFPSSCRKASADLEGWGGCGGDAAAATPGPCRKQN